MTAYRKAWSAVVFVLGLSCVLIALISFPLGALIVVSGCCGLVCSAGGFLLTEERRDNPHPWANCRRDAWIGACAGFVALGAGAAAGPAGVLLVGLAVASAPDILLWSLTRLSLLRAPGQPAESGLAPAAGARLPRQWTRQVPPQLAGPPAAWSGALTNDELISAWRQSFTHLSHVRSAAEMQYCVEIRRRLLDEVERRDPEGFANWLHGGARAAGDPPAT